MTSDDKRMGRRAFLKLSAAAATLSAGGYVGDLALNATAQAATSNEDAKLLAFFSQSFTRDLEESPEFMTQLGMKKRYGEWDDYSREFAEHAHLNALADGEFMRGEIDRAALSEPMRVSYD